MIGKLIKLILGLIFITVAITFLPDNIKRGTMEKTRSLVDLVLPDALETKIQKKLDPFLHTPIERRAKLLDQLEANIRKIKETLGESDAIAESAATPLIEQLNETETLVGEIKKANADPTIVEQATQKLTSILSPATPSPPTSPSTSSCSWVCKNED